MIDQASRSNAVGGQAHKARALVVLAVLAPFFVLAVVLAMFTGTGLETNGRPLIVTAVAVITVAQIMVLRRANGTAMPLVTIPITVVNLVGVTGYLYFRDFAGVAEVSYQLPTGNAELDAAARIFALASVSLFFGALVGGIRRRGERSSRSARMQTRELATAISRLPRGALLLACAIPVLSEAIALGPAGLISRQYYLDAWGPSWTVSIGQAFIPVAVAGAAVVFFDRTQRDGRLWALGLLFADFTVVFARGSRLLGVLPIIVLGAYLIQRRDQPIRNGVVAVAALLCAVLLVQLPLASRARNQGAGLAPYVSALVADPGAAVGRNGASGFIGNILFAVPLAGFVATDVAAEPAGELPASLNPLPSGLASWNTFADGTRVDANTPYSALGELGLNGTAMLIGYFVVVGCLLSRLQRLSTRLVGLRSVIMQIALAGLVLSFSLSVLQYNLRTSSRYVWYALGIYLVLRFAPGLQERMSRPSDLGSTRLAPQAPLRAGVARRSAQR